MARRLLWSLWPHDCQWSWQLDWIRFLSILLTISIFTDGISWLYFIYFAYHLKLQILNVLVKCLMSTTVVIIGEGVKIEKKKHFEFDLFIKCWSKASRQICLQSYWNKLVSNSYFVVVTLLLSVHQKRFWQSVSA